MRQHIYTTAGLSLLIILLSFSPQAQTLLNPKTQPQFVNPLPIPPVIDMSGGGSLTMTISQFQQNLGLINPSNPDKQLLTTVWGYNGKYPGPTILAQKDKALNVTWENKLIGNDGKNLAHLLPVDISIEWALKEEAGEDNDDNALQKLGVPVVTHLHGGHTESASDGLPEAWYTPNFAIKGKGFVKSTLRYENDQEAATLWYHDHAMGITRLNVYAGLAGYYLLTDDNEKKLQQENKIPKGAYDIGLAIQDRMFTTDGQLYYPTASESLGGPEKSIQPEFFGNVILVNGAAWPVLEVEPRPYRFRILNGSDSRFYDLFLSSGQSFTQIGSDGGFLPSPLIQSHILIGTGERKDVVLDFSAYSGQTIILHNNAKTPYPKGSTVNPQTTGRIMAFKVTKPLSSEPKAVLPAVLRPAIAPLQTSLQARKLILFESEDEYDRLKVLLGTFEKGIMDFDDPITENPALNSTEIWEIYNETVDAHTIHLHLVQMQLLSRQRFRSDVDMETGKPTNVRLIGMPKLPAPEEKGWKDTYVMLPGEVTRVIAKFDRAGLYVWHCHILSHEDHEMMRPFLVSESKSATNTTVDASQKTKQQLQLRTLPNPFTNTLTLQFNLPQESYVSITVYNTSGEKVQQLFNGKRNAGIQRFTIDGTRWSNGTYFCEVMVDNQRLMRKLVLQK